MCRQLRNKLKVHITYNKDFLLIKNTFRIKNKQLYMNYIELKKIDQISR